MTAAPRKTLLLSAAGAVLGLAVAGYGLFTANGTRTAHVPAEDVALVNGVPILREDFIQQLGSLYGVTLSAATPAQKHKVLADMVQEELTVQRGVEMGLLTDDTDVRTALVTGMEGQIAQDADAEVPSEAQVRAWYDSHRQVYAGEGQMTVSEWIVPHGIAPEAAMKAPPNGRTNDGTEFYFAARLHLGPALFRVAQGLHDGQVSTPVPMPDGVHVLRMVSNHPPVPISYDEAHPRVIQDMRADARKRAQRENAAFLTRRADVRVADDMS
jgi:hypothetical protein